MFIARIFDWIADIVWKPIDKVLESKFMQWYESKIWNPMVEYWFITIPILFAGFHLVVMIRIFV